MEFQFQSLLSNCCFQLLQLKGWLWPVSSLGFLCLISFFWYYRHRNRQAINHWPLLGTLPSLIRNSDRLCEWFTEVFTSLNKGSFYIDGPVFTNLRFLVTCDPKNIEYILKTNINNFPKLPQYTQAFDIFGEGIINADSDPWRMQRRIAHSNFTSKDFRMFVAKMTGKVIEDQLVPFLSDVAKHRRVIDLQDVYSKLAFDLNMGVLFGRRERYLSINHPAHELAEAVVTAEETMMYRFRMPEMLWKLMRTLRVGPEGKHAKARSTIDSAFQKYILQKREDLLRGVESFDLLSSYIKSSEDKNNKFLKDAMVNYTVAGKDTVVSGLTWFFWLVHQNPSVEMKILEELNNLVSSTDKNGTTERSTQPLAFDSDDLKGLVYLHAALCESLRLCPPVPVNVKSVVKEDVLPDGSLVKPGMEVFLSIYSVARLSWIWGEDCMEFNPERWIDSETGKLSHEHDSKFFAFNYGPRTCIGKDLALTYMKSVVAAVLFNFHVQVVEGHNVCPKTSIAHYMGNGLMVNIRERIS